MMENDVIAENMAPYPIYTAMICIMWREFNEERRKTMQNLQTFSQLFAEMIGFLSEHFISKKVSCSASGHMSVEECLAQIGQIALEGLLDRKMAFDEEDFRNNRVLETGCRVGILTREYTRIIRRKGRRRHHVEVFSVVFSHKLFQEYVAALGRGRDLQALRVNDGHVLFRVALTEALVPIERLFGLLIEIEQHAHDSAYVMLDDIALARAIAVTDFVKREPVCVERCSTERPCRANPPQQTPSRHVGTIGKVDHGRTLSQRRYHALAEQLDAVSLVFL